MMNGVSGSSGKKLPSMFVSPFCSAGRNLQPSTLLMKKYGAMNCPPPIGFPPTDPPTLNLPDFDSMNAGGIAAAIPS
jgi:hypothetical protein